jgi:hypothetical protein
MGGDPVVEVMLFNGHALRVRSVVDVSEGRVTLETYQGKGDLAHHRPRFGQATERGSGSGHDTFRAVIAYESIVAVVLDPTPVQARSRPGFGSL